MPTPEESARHALAVMRERGLKAGETAMAGWFALPFNSGRWRACDFLPGMRYAYDQGWVIFRGRNFIIELTAEGEAEMHGRNSHPGR